MQIGSVISSATKITPELVAEHGLKPEAQDILGAYGRKLFFATATGEVWLSYLDPEQTRRAEAHRLIPEAPE